MTKRHGFNFPYLDVDSRRIQQAFFTQPAKKRKSKNKMLLWLIPSVVLVLAITLYFFLTFEFIFISKSDFKSPDSRGLLNNQNISSIRLTNPDKSFMRVINSSVYLNFAQEEGVALEINFKNPQNISNSDLSLLIKNIYPSFDMNLIFKDEDFFSNAQNPKQVKIDSDKRYFLKIPVILDAGAYEKINFKRIKQIRVLLAKSETSDNKPKALTLSKQKKWIIIKDFILEKKVDR